MRRLARILLIGLLPALLTGCLPESRNPVTSVESAVADDRLIGLWSTRIEDENLFLHVLKADHNKFDILVVSHHSDGGGAIDRYQGHVSALGDRRFVNLQPVGDSTVDNSNPDLSFLIVGYDLTGPDRLVARFLAEQPLIDGIASGALSGEVIDEGEALGRSIVLSSDSAGLAKYLAAGDSATIFDRSVEFVRVTASN